MVTMQATEKHGELIDEPGTKRYYERAQIIGNLR